MINTGEQPWQMSDVSCSLQYVPAGDPVEPSAGGNPGTEPYHLAARTIVLPANATEPAVPVFDTKVLGTNSFRTTITNPDPHATYNHQVRVVGETELVVDDAGLDGSSPVFTWALSPGVKHEHRWRAVDGLMSAWSAWSEVELPAALTGLPAPNLLHDDFESGGTASTNSDGFSWNGYLGDVHAVAQAPRGTYARRVPWGATTHVAERKFTLGEPKFRTLWVSYLMRIPTNYWFSNGSHGQHKLFVMLQDGYSQNGSGSTVWANIRQSGDLARCYMQYREGSTGPSNGEAPGDNTLFHAINDRGRVMEMVFQFTLESSPGAKDGTVRWYRRWEEESTYTLMIEEVGSIELTRSVTVGREGWYEGYILSAREGEAAEDQTFYIDEFKLSTESLVEGFI